MPCAFQITNRTHNILKSEKMQISGVVDIKIKYYIPTQNIAALKDHSHVTHCTILFLFFVHFGTTRQNNS